MTNTSPEPNPGSQVEIGPAADSALDLSVVVFLREDADTALPTLRALVAQGKALSVEIILADASESGGPKLDEFDLGTIQHLRLDTAPMPVLKGRAIQAARGQRIAIIDPHDIPADDWIENIVRELPLVGDLAAIGGQVIRGSATQRSDAALYLFEYGAFAPPLEDGDTEEDLPGNNLAYLSSALKDRCGDLLSEGFWKPFIHQRLREQGQRLALRSALRVRHETNHHFWKASTRRFHYGRCFGAMRLVQSSAARKFLYRVAGPIVPLLLVQRHLRRAFSDSRLKTAARRGWLPLIGVCLAWGIGECLGYWFGPGRSCERVY